MFFKLFAKECGQMLKSLIYYLFLAALIFFYVSQVGSFTPYSEPLKGQEESYIDLAILILPLPAHLLI